MKKIITKYASPIALLLVVAAFSSCVKERNAGATDFSLATAVVQIPEGGLDATNFGGAALLFSPSDIVDTAYFRINYADKTVATSDIVVTLGYSDAALAAYNAANPTGPYVKMPDSTCSFTTTKVTIKAGQSYSDPIPFVVRPYKFDPSKSFMFPISITDASGKAISGNYGTIYFHVIGNPLAGTYVVTGIRYNYNGGPAGASGTFDGNPAHIPTNYTGTTAIPTPKQASPVDANTVTIDFANLGVSGYQYLLTQKNNFASINVDFNAAMYAGDSNINWWLYSYTSPIGQKAKFRILVQYVNNAVPASGNDRILDESFVQQ